MDHNLLTIEIDKDIQTLIASIYKELTMYLFI